VFTATSSELLDALVGIVTPRIRELMDSTALLTGAPRVAETAGRLGLGSPVMMARNPADEALVEALYTWTAARHRPSPDA
jgi:uroporphyrinogen-III synthase